MLANVGWKWKEEQSQPATGCSISKSSRLEAFDEQWPTPPLNSMECEQFRRIATRYEQLSQTFLALIHLVAAWIIIK
jgi:hypothetical protein